MAYDNGLNTIQRSLKIDQSIIESILSSVWMTPPSRSLCQPRNSINKPFLRSISLWRNLPCHPHVTHSELRKLEEMSWRELIWFLRGVDQPFAPTHESVSLTLVVEWLRLAAPGGCGNRSWSMSLGGRRGRRSLRTCVAINHVTLRN